MTSRSAATNKPKRRKHRDRADYGFARARDLAFDAVQSLWRRRRSQGMKQIDIARALDREPAWVNRSLRGPGNWTLRTFGELVEALNGEIDISVHALEDPLPTAVNYHAYAGYETPSYTDVQEKVRGATLSPRAGSAGAAAKIRQVALS
jgi:hypothetical protein